MVKKRNVQNKNFIFHGGVLFLFGSYRMYIRFSMAAYDIPIKLSAKNFCSFKYIEVTSIYILFQIQRTSKTKSVWFQKQTSTFEHDPAFSKHHHH